MSVPPSVVKPARFAFGWHGIGLAGRTPGSWAGIAFPAGTGWYWCASPTGVVTNGRSGRP